MLGRMAGIGARYQVLPLCNPVPGKGGTSRSFGSPRRSDDLSGPEVRWEPCNVVIKHRMAFVSRFAWLG
jgi:hypothetical protein